MDRVGEIPVRETSPVPPPRSNQGRKHMPYVRNLVSTDFSKVSIAQELSSVTPRLEILIDEEAKKARRADPLYRDAMLFTQGVSKEVHTQFLSDLTAQAQRSHVPGRRVLTFLKEQNLLVPQFTLADAWHGLKLLGKLGFPRETLWSDGYVLVFNFPKPVAQYWKKGTGGLPIEEAIDVRGMVTEWGTMYQNLVRLIWRARDTAEEKEQLFFRRINSAGQHDPKSYYYIWEIAKVPFKDDAEQDT